MLNLTNLATGTSSPAFMNLYSVEVDGRRLSDYTTIRDRALRWLMKLRKLDPSAKLRTDLYYLTDSTLR